MVEQQKKVPGIKSEPNKASWKRRQEQKRSKWSLNNRARAEMNSKMSSMGSTHLQASDARCLEFHRFIDSMRVRTERQS